MILIKILMSLIVFSLPFFAGVLLKRETIFETYLFGQVLTWAIFQLIAVPMILLHLPFMVLFVSYVVILLLVTIYGTVFLKKGKVKFEIKKEEINCYLIPAIIIILFQMGMYFLGMHLDEDDARWIAEANDALEKNKMLLYNPATGDFIGHFTGEMTKDVFSPWSMYIATLSRMAFVRPATMAHTFYPPVLLGISYLIYYHIGKNLFKNKFERGAFLLLVTVIMLFFGGNRYTQAAFLLTRIWQGKAVVAAIVIPLMLLVLLLIEKKNENANWFLLAISSASACLFSGMGIIFSAVLIGFYGLYALVFNKFRNAWIYLISLLFPVAYGLLYYYLFKI